MCKPFDQEFEVRYMNTVGRGDAAMCLAAKAVMIANRIVEEFVKNSNVFDGSKFRELPRYHPEELNLGHIIGNGGFNHVVEIRGMTIRKRGTIGPDSRNEEKEEKDKSDEKLPSLREDGSPQVVKFLRGSLYKNQEIFQQGAADIMTETCILSSLDHPNIIKLRGVSSFGTAGFASRRYFIILDRVSRTLDIQINCWKLESQKFNLFTNMFIDFDGAKRAGLLKSRLTVALELARAMSYLHDKNIIYRDLKAENVGIDFDGSVKLIDFGLAKELNPRKKMLDDRYKLSGNTGSRRYMAPEIAKNLPYNLSADVYSFAILLWQMCALEKPFGDFIREEHDSMVVHGDVRPVLDAAWPLSVRGLLDESWSSDPSKRPRFKKIVETLERVCG